MRECMFDYASTSCARATGLSFFFTNAIDEFCDKVYWRYDFSIEHTVAMASQIYSKNKTASKKYILCRGVGHCQQRCRGTVDNWLCVNATRYMNRYMYLVHVPVSQWIRCSHSFHITYLQSKKVGLCSSCKKFSPIYKYTMLHVQSSKAICPVLVAKDRKGVKVWRFWQ